jgi:hypothetical protein
VGVGVLSENVVCVLSWRSQRDLDGTISKFMVRYKYPSFGVQLMVHFTIRHGNALSRQ